MQEDNGECYLCKILHNDSSVKYTEEHHCIYGTANRKLSEKYGLKVYLCPEHHRTGSEAVHFNRNIDLLVKSLAEEAFIKRYPGKSFLKVFGRNYLPEKRIKAIMGDHSDMRTMSNSQQDSPEGFKLL